MKRKLALIEKPSIITDCPIFYRLSIIETIANHENWLVNNFNSLISSSELGIFYGNNEQAICHINYYDMILEQDPFAANNSTTYEQTLNYIVQSINDNKYVLIECNLNLLLKNSAEFKDKAKTHELLIYGYDDTEKKFYNAVIPETNTTPKLISYNDVISSFSNRKDYSYEKRKTDLLTRRTALYPLSTLKQKKYTKDICLLSFFHDIRKIYDSGRMSEMILGNKNWIPYNAHEGYLIAYLTLLQVLNNKEIISNNYNLKLNIKKIHEFKSNFNSKINKICKLFNLVLSDNYFIKSRYVLEKLDISCKYAIKIEITEDYKYIDKIKLLIVDCYQTELRLFDYLYCYLLDFLIDNNFY